MFSGLAKGGQNSFINIEHIQRPNLQAPTKGETPQADPSKDHLRLAMLTLFCAVQLPKYQPSPNTPPSSSGFKYILT